MDEIKRIRDERGLTQQALADLAGINKVTLNHIEQGKGNPSVSTLEKIAGALDVEVRDFFPKAEPSFEDLVERSRDIEDQRRGDRRRYFQNKDALTDEQLRTMASGLRESDIPAKHWSNKAARQEEVSLRRFVVGAMLEDRAGKASKGEKEAIATFTGEKKPA